MKLNVFKKYDELQSKIIEQEREVELMKSRLKELEHQFSTIKKSEFECKRLEKLGKKLSQPVEEHLEISLLLEDKLTFIEYLKKEQNKLILCRLFNKLRTNNHTVFSK